MPDQTPALRQVGIGADGQPLYAYRDAAPVVMPAPIAPARPWGAYIALGAVGVGGVVALSFAVAVVAVALSIGAVSLTICTLVLRSMWQHYQADRKSA